MSIFCKFFGHKYTDREIKKNHITTTISTCSRCGYKTASTTLTQYFPYKIKIGKEKGGSMTYKEFEWAMNSYLEFEKKVDKLDEAFKGFCSDNAVFSFELSYSMIRLISMNFRDNKNARDTIEWWLFDLTDNEDKIIWHKYKKTYKLNTLRKLYNYLCKFYGVKQ